MGNLQTGFARVNVTPMTGIGLDGYYQDRRACGVLDELELSTLALRSGDACVLLMSVDHCGVAAPAMDELRRCAAEAAGIPPEAVFLSATHTHTGPLLRPDSPDPLEAEYLRFLARRAADAARYAAEDLKPARMGWAVGRAPGIAFIRRYRMRDGGIQTNPGLDNPDIVSPAGTADEDVTVLRFDREGGENIVLVHFACHPDTIGGNRFSADWPGFLRRTVERALEGTRCIFFNGAEGDVNHVDVHPAGGALNDLARDFDGVFRGYGHARHMGRTVAGAVLQVYGKAAGLEAEGVRWAQTLVSVPSNRPRPEDMEQARHIAALHRAGRDGELPFRDMALTTAVAEAERMLALEHGPEAFRMPLSAVSVGGAAFLGLPGEPFSGIGRALKKAPGWTLALPCCLTNGSEGYFPMREAYDEGGYEARSSRFRAGVAELLIEEGLALLASLRE